MASIGPQIRIPFQPHYALWMLEDVRGSNCLDSLFRRWSSPLGSSITEGNTRSDPNWPCIGLVVASMRVLNINRSEGVSYPVSCAAASLSVYSGLSAGESPGYGGANVGLGWLTWWYSTRCGAGPLMFHVKRDQSGWTLLLGRTVMVLCDYLCLPPRSGWDYG